MRLTVNSNKAQVPFGEPDNAPLAENIDETTNGIIEESKIFDVNRKLVKVHGVNDLSVGDHIVFNRLRGYEHHAIITALNVNTNEITVAEYTKEERYKLEFILKENTSPLSNNSLINKFIYKEGYDPEVVIKKARSRINEKKYALLSNNCEHFATWAKTGNNHSDQVAKGIFSLKSSLVSSSLKTMHSAPRVTEISEFIGKNYAKLLSYNKFTKFCEINEFAAASVSEIGQRYIFSNLIGAVLCGLLLTAEFCIVLKQLIDDKEKYDEEVFKEKIFETICSYGFAIGLGVLVALLASASSILGLILSFGFVFAAISLGMWGGKCFGRIVNYYCPSIKNIVYSTGITVKNAVSSVKNAVRDTGKRMWSALTSWWRK